MDLTQATGSDRMVTSAGFSKDGGIEGETEGGRRWRPEGGRDEKDIKEGEKTEGERSQQ